MLLPYRYPLLLGLLLLNSCQSTRPAFYFGSQPMPGQSDRDSAGAASVPVTSAAAVSASGTSEPLLPRPAGHRLARHALRPAAARPVTVQPPRRPARWATVRSVATLSRPKAPAAEADTLTLFMLLALGVVVAFLGLLLIFTFTPTTVLIGVLLLAGSIPALLISVAGLRYNLRKR